jgi:hypothetical protein
LFLSWYVRADPSSDPFGDRLNVIFGSQSGIPSTADPDVQVEVWPRRRTGGVAPTIDAFETPILAVSQRTSPGGGWSSVASSAVSWLADLRAFVETGGWAIEAHVKTVSGTTLPGSGEIRVNPNNLRIWSELRVATMSGPAFYDWPVDVRTFTDPLGTLLFPAMPATWANCPPLPADPINFKPCFWRTTPIGGSPSTKLDADAELRLASWNPAPGSCSNKGVSLSPSDIDVTPTSQTIELPPITNVFSARPVNHSGSPIDLNKLQAEFRIANWGSTVWENVPTGVTIWDKIPSSDPNPVANGAPIPIDGAATLSVSWKVADPQLTLLTTKLLSKHQCVLVELFSSVPGLKLLKKSVYRNMNYATPNSPFVDNASISIVGLDSAAGMGPTRTVYLYVETKNLPRSVGSSVQAVDSIIFPRDSARLRGTSGALLDRHTIGVRRIDSLAGRIDTIPPAAWDTLVVPPRASGERERVLRSAEEGGVLPWHLMDGLMPTYKVHAYHETGDSAIVEGVKLPILRPQTSFGYWVDYRGELRGWKHSLKGVGTTLEEIAPNWYKLSIPHHGTATVRIAIDPLAPMPRIVVLLLVLIGLLVLLLLLCLLRCAHRARHA